MNIIFLELSIFPPFFVWDKGQSIRGGGGGGRGVFIIGIKWVRDYSETFINPILSESRRRLSNELNFILVISIAKNL